MTDCVCLSASLSVSSALLPHASAEEKGASRGSHSGEGRLDRAPPHAFVRASQPATTSPSPIPPATHVSIFSTAGCHVFHCTGQGETATCLTKMRQPSDYSNKRKILSVFLSCRISLVILETCLQSHCCCWSLNQKPQRCGSA